MDLNNMTYDELEQLIYQLSEEMAELKAKRREVARIMDELRREELRENPPDPGQTIG